MKLGSGDDGWGHRRWFVLVAGVALVLLLLWAAPRIWALAWLNLSSLDELSVQHASSEPGVYPYENARVAGSLETAGQMLLDRATVRVVKALAALPGSCSMRWAAARSLELQGEMDAARDLLLPCADRLASHPLAQIDLLAVLSASGPSDRLLPVYHANQVGPEKLPRAVRDALLLELESMAASALSQGDETAARQALQEALVLRPGDLYANEQMMVLAGATGDVAPYEIALDNYAHEAIDPVDARLIGYAAQTWPSLITSGAWTADRADSVVAFVIERYFAAPETEQAITGLREAFPDDGRWAMRLGDLFMARSDPATALQAYRDAAIVTPDDAVVLARLGRILTATCLDSTGGSGSTVACSEAHDVWNRYADLWPDDPTGIKALADLCARFDCETTGWQTRLEQLLAARQPSHVLNLARNRLPDGWVLLGYDVDEGALVRGEPAPMWLYWVVPRGESFELSDPDVYRFGDRVVRYVEGVRSIAPNGGFELGLEDGLPFGYPTTYHHAEAAGIAAVRETREGVDTTVAEAKTTAMDTPTGLESAFLPLDGDGVYLEAGWIHSTSADAYLGISWEGVAQDGDVAPYSYVAAAASSPEWQHFAGWAIPPASASGGRIWLLNTSPARDASVRFDDIVLVDLSPWIAPAH